MPEKTPWYKKKEYFGVAALVLGGVKQFTPPHTASHQASDYLLTIGLPLLMGYFGVKDAKKYGTPSGVSKITSSITSSAKKDILEMLSKSVDKDGYIVEKSNPEQRVLTFDVEEITLDDFGGFQRGSEVFIKNNVVSLMKLAKR